MLHNPKQVYKKDLTIYVTSDIHYLAEATHDDGEAFQTFIRTGDGKLMHYAGKLMDAFTAEAAKNKKPNIFILSGDLTNNGEEINHKELAQKLSVLESNGTKAYVIPGNHDINNPYARTFSGDKQLLTNYVTPDGFEKIYHDFGYGEAIARDTHSLSYIAAPAKDLWLLMLDTCLYDRNIAWGASQSDGEIKPETQEWIEREVKKANEQHIEVIAVMHHNLMDHSELLRKGYTLNNANDIVSLFDRLHIQLALSGHIHIQDIAHTKPPEGQDEIYEIVSEAFGIWPNQYGAITFKQNALHYETKPLNTTFSDFSKQWFGNRSYDRVYQQLKDVDRFTEDEKVQMSEVMRDVNLSYFSGHTFFDAPELKASPGFKLWMDYQDEFRTYYISSILETETLNDILLDLPERR